MKNFCALLLALATACHAQAPRNEVGTFAVANFNPTSYIYLSDRTPVISSNRSSLGWGAEYQRWLSDHYALGAIFEQNPSDGKLYDGAKYYRWPQMHYEMGVVMTEQLTVGKFSPYLREGAGGIVTNGYSNCGWSHDFAFITGFGASYRTGPRTALRAGMTILNAQTGCYGDHTCRETWSHVQDFSIGITYRWGFGSSPRSLTLRSPKPLIRKSSIDSVATPPPSRAQ